MADRIGSAVLEIRTDAQAFLEGMDKVAGAIDGVGKHLESSAQKGISLGGVLQSALGAFTGFISAQAVMRGVSAAFDFAKDAVFGMNSTLETSTLQFATLMGDTDRAREHVRDLFEFAKKTPFETGPIIEASRMLRTFGGNALDSMKNLTLLGDASAATGAPIQELGFWVGRMFAMLQGGKPFGEAAMRLQELAVLSPKARDQMEALQKSGASSEKVFAVFTDSIKKFGGAMEEQAGTWEGVTSTFSDTVKILIADTFKPFFELVRDGLRAINDALGSDGVAKAMDTFKTSVQGAFGNNTGKTIETLAKGFLSFGDTVLGVIQFTYQGWQAFRSVVALAVATVLEGITQVSEASSRALEIASKVDPTGKLAEWAQAGKENAAFMRGLTNEYWDQQKAAHAAAEGNDAVGATLGGIRTVLQTTAANLKITTKAVDETADAHKRLGKAADDSGESTTRAGKKTKEAAIYALGGVEEAFAKISDLARKQGEEDVKANQKTAEELNKIQLQHADVIIDSIVRTEELRRQTQTGRRDDEFAAAEYSIQQAEREGAKKSEIARMERELSLSRLNAAIADSDAEYQIKADGIDRTTAYGEAEYEALADSHAVQVQRMRDDWQRGQQAIQTITTESWGKTVDTLARSFEQLSNIGGKCFSDLTRGIGTVIGSLSTVNTSWGSFRKGMEDFTGGGGLGSILKGLSGIVGGIGGIVAAASAAVQGIKALMNAFKSEETLKVNKPRTEFQESFGGFDQLASRLTNAFVGLGEEDAGNKASALLRQMNDADTEAEWNSAKRAILDIFSKAGEDIPALGTGGIVTRATTAIVGESGPEAVMPLDYLANFVGGNGTVQNITIELDGSVLTRTVARGLPRELHLAGLAGF